MLTNISVKEEARNAWLSYRTAPIARKQRQLILSARGELFLLFREDIRDTDTYLVVSSILRAPSSAASVWDNSWISESVLGDFVVNVEGSFSLDFLRFSAFAGLGSE